MKPYPILFCGFRRFFVFKKVLSTNYEALKKRRIYLSLDGPITKKDFIYQKKIINLFKKTFRTLKYQILSVNVGCGEGVPQGITWFFKHEAKGIIIEDDIFFEHSFLQSADLFLHTNSDKNSTAYFIGYNPLPFCINTKRLSPVFRISGFHWIWGWATSRKAWSLYDKNVVMEHPKNILFYSRFFSDDLRIRLFFVIWSLLTRQNKNRAWDIRWFLSCAKNNKLAVVSSQNLTINSGNDAFASHTQPNYISNQIISKRKVSSKTFFPRSLDLDKLAYLLALELTPRKFLRCLFSLFVPNSLFYFFRNRLKNYIFSKHK